MIKYLKLLAFLTFLGLSGCGDDSIDQQNRFVENSFGSTQTEFSLRVKHRCDLSDITNRSEIQFDFKHSLQPAVTIRRRYIQVFRPIPGMAEADRNAEIRRLLAIRILRPNQIVVRSENPICTATQFNLGNNLENGHLPLQSLLQEDCPMLKNHNIFSDVDSSGARAGRQNQKRF